MPPLLSRAMWGVRRSVENLETTRIRKSPSGSIICAAHNVGINSGGSAFRCRRTAMMMTSSSIKRTAERIEARRLSRFQTVQCKNSCESVAHNSILILNFCFRCVTCYFSSRDFRLRL